MRRKIMKSLFLVIGLFFISQISFAQNLEDVVYLKDGSIIRGVILELIPSESVKIQTLGGSVFVFQMDKITKITKEAPISSNSNTNPSSNPPPTNNTSNAKTEYQKVGKATCLSILLPGTGQYYNKQPGKGVIFTTGYVAGISTIVASIRANSGSGSTELLIVGLGGIALIEVISAIDANVSAKRINRTIDLNSDYQFEITPVFYPSYGSSAENLSFNSGLSLRLSF